MTAGELVMILVEQYQPDDYVSVCYWNGEGVTVGEIQQVARNGGPSLYVTEWEGPEDNETTPQ